METAYHEEMVAVGTALLEKLAENEAELDALPEDARLLLQDKDALLGASAPPTTSASQNSTRRRTRRARSRRRI